MVGLGKDTLLEYSRHLFVHTHTHTYVYTGLDESEGYVAGWGV